jgi:hypothetical protein
MRPGGLVATDREEERVWLAWIRISLRLDYELPGTHCLVGGRERLDARLARLAEGRSGGAQPRR